MLINWIRWLKGYVLFTAWGKFPERFINLTIKNGIFIWDMESKNNKITGKMSASDYLRIRRIARKTLVKTRVKKRSGLPFVIKRYKPRIGMLIGIAVFAVIMFVLTSHVWAININGLETLSYTYVMEILNKNGLEIGKNIDSLNISQIERATILDDEKIGWMSINIIGTVATVEVKEKADQPVGDDNTTVCNIKAAKDGVITSINAYKGKTMVEEGSAVVKGQLLVSAILEDTMGGVTYVHAKAKAMARTYETKVFTQPLIVQLYLPQEQAAQRYKAKFLTGEFPVTAAYLPQGEYARQYTHHRIVAGEITLPVGLIKEESVLYKNTKLTFDKKSAKQALEKKMVLYETLEKSNTIVLDKKITEKVTKNSIIYTVDYVFEEDIAMEEMLEVS